MGSGNAWTRGLARISWRCCASAAASPRSRTAAPAGPVRLLRGPGRRQAEVHLRHARARGQGKHILTLDGLPAAERDLISDCFAAAAGLQCGFCIPGIALRAKALSTATPRRRASHRPRAGRAPVPLHRLREDHRRDRVAGRRQARRRAHPAGLQRRPGRPAAGAYRRRADGAGRAALRRRPDGRACCTAPWRCRRTRAPACCASTPRAPARCRAWAPSPPRRTCPASAGTACSTTTGPASSPRAKRCAASGDVLAAVAAVDRHTAREAAELVDVSYEVLPPLLDPLQALAPGAPQVNPQACQPAVALGHPARRRDAALAASAHVVSGTWQTQRIEHLFLEPESALAEPRPTAGLHLSRRARASSTTGGRWRASWACPRGPGLRRAGAQRRRVRRQGRHVGAGADRAAGARDAAGR